MAMLVAAVSPDLVYFPWLIGSLVFFTMWFVWPTAVVILLYQYGWITKAFYAHMFLILVSISSLTLLVLTSTPETERPILELVLTISTFGLLATAIIAISLSGLLSDWPLSWFLIGLSVFYIVFGILFLSPALRRGITDTLGHQA